MTTILPPNGYGPSPKPHRDPALPKTQRLRPVAPKRRGDAAKRHAAEQILWEVRPRCWRCGVGGPLHGHEIRRRSQGGDSTNPDCLLCPECNRWAAQGDLRQAAWEGWLETAKHPAMPCIADGSCLPWEHKGCDAA